MAAFPYDVKLSISGGASYGFMLATPPGQSKQLAVQEVATPEGQYEINRLASEAGRNTTDFNMKDDTVVAQGDWSGGLGDLEYNPDNNTYWWGAVVTHTQGKMYAPPKSTFLTLSATTGLIDGWTTYLTSAGTRYDFVWQATRLYRRDASNSSNTWSLVYTAGANITDVTIVDGAALICVPSLAGTTDFLRQADPTAAATWAPTAMLHTAFSDTNGKPAFMEVVRGTTYAACNGVNSGSGVINRKIFYTTDPNTDAWVGPIDTSLSNNLSGPPGNQSHPFTNLIAVNDFLFALKRDAGYSIDSQQEVTEVLWMWKDKPSVDQFKYVAVGNEMLFYSISPEVYAYDPQTGRNTPLGFSRKSGFSCQDILGVAADNQYVYVLAKVVVPRIDNTSAYALFRCWKTGAARWAMECLFQNSSAYTGLFASPQGAGNGTRVYIFAADGLSSVHFDIPADWDESTSGSFGQGLWYSSVLRTGFANFVKRWLWWATQTQGVDADDTLALAYSTDEGSTFTTLATLTAAGLTFTGLTNVNAQSIVLRMALTSGAGTNTPVVRGYDMHSRVRWRYLPKVELNIRIADYIELLNGVRATEKATDIAANMRALRASDGTILYEDFLGNSFNVSVDAIAFRPTRHEISEKSSAGSYEMEGALTLSRADSGA